MSSSRSLSLERPLFSCRAHSPGILLHSHDLFSIHLLVMPTSSSSLNLSSFLQGACLQIPLHMRFIALHAQHPKAELYCHRLCPWALSLLQGHLLPSRRLPAKLRPLSLSSSDFPSSSLEHQAFFLSPKSIHMMSFRPLVIRATKPTYTHKAVTTPSSRLKASRTEPLIQGPQSRLPLGDQGYKDKWEQEDGDSWGW